MSIFDDDQKSMLDVYLYETNNLFEQLDTILMRTEKNHSFTKEDIHSIFRIMHTTKSSSSMMNLQNIATLMHTVEDLFSVFRDLPKKIIDNESETFDLLFDISDFMHRQLERIKDEDYLPDNAAKYILRTQRLLGKITTINENKESNEKEVPVIKDEQKLTLDKSVWVRLIYEKECRMENIRAYMVVTQIQKLCINLTYYPNELENNPKAADFIKNNGFYIQFEAVEPKKVLETLHRSLFIEKCEIIDKNEYDSKIYKSIDKKETDIKDKNKSLESSSVIPVHVSKLNSLQNLVSELMIAESSMISLMEQYGQKELLQQFEKTFHKSLLDIEEIVMSSKLVPVSQIIPKLNRIVRDISHKENKEINFIVKGEEIEIDKEIVDSLFEPLMHLLRNAVDHGIETKEERAVLHKPEIGEIILKVENINSEILVHIIDDGKGLDPNKIKEKAKEKGILKDNHDYGDEDILYLIMQPGFSTNKQVSEFSGRGVGMDVVKNMIDKFKGHISIKSELNKGTHFTLHLPLTLSIIESLVFCVKDSIFSIPAHNVKHFFSYKKNDLNIKEENNHFVYIYNNEVLPIIHLDKYFNITYKKDDAIKILIYVESANKKACIVVDNIIGYQHLVGKPLPLLFDAEFKKSTAISGCSILSDGSICMILNIEWLLNKRGDNDE